ncbi:acyl-CoA N-acyltransferase [Gonapodya prolifera JEL478]|uniref:Acyl-CoA N-acyltransferase n=1 Tax=Gonapodya prolifera (strain JEL478) TaxID=1344416 RepID=A0A139ASQ3_GONPJ|nr:acyl-CoA N-acyltransferase [Gonapodya prolifera JEL478]|eukprot:KXS19770.1 acyl-CoA N-acyltransferase [Gonapodya prolifera JEL478]
MALPLSVSTQSRARFSASIPMTLSSEEYTIRPIDYASDVEAIHEIYCYEVLNHTATWEVDPPTLGEMRDRVKNVLDAGFPWYVAIKGDQVVGYSYASAYRPRVGYRYSVENSVYVAQGHQRHGLGIKLLKIVIEACTKLGYRAMIAVIGTSSSGSIELHASCGFSQTGFLQNIGFKFGRWISITIMQLPLGDGYSTPGGELKRWNRDDM